MTGMTSKTPALNTHREDVKAAVRRTGITLSELALRHGVKPSTVRASLRRPIPAGNRIVAAYLGKSVHELWPEWFDADGVRLCRPYRRKASRGQLQDHG